jgi:hypothetical protein
MIRSASLCVMLLVPTLAAAQAPQARNVRLNTVHNVVQNGQKGMRIEVDFDVDDLAGREVNCSAYFFFKNGTRLGALPGTPAAYRTPDGQMTTQARAVIKGDRIRCNVDLFIPYTELTGNIVPLDLMYQVDITYNDGLGWRLLNRTGDQHFRIR